MSVRIREMIQRIQSLYIAIVIFLSSLMLHGNTGSFMAPDGTEYELRYNGLYVLASGTWQKIENMVPLATMLITMPVLALITLFLYRFRKLQLRAAMFTLLLFLGEILLLGFYLFFIRLKYDVSIILTLKIIFPPILSILMYLAFRNILKDELLIKSYERLR